MHLDLWEKKKKKKAIFRCWDERDEREKKRKKEKQKRKREKKERKRGEKNEKKKEKKKGKEGKERKRGKREKTPPPLCEMCVCTTVFCVCKRLLETDCTVLYCMDGPNVPRNVL